MAEKGIKETVDSIRLNIEEVEKNGATPELLSAIDDEFHRMMELIKLFLISERDTYYGYFLMNMRFKADFFSATIAGIILNTNPPVLSANPLILCKLSLKEILYVVCHEIEHVLLNHPEEMLRLCAGEPQQKYFLFNVAADASVNDRLNGEIITEKEQFLAQPEGAITSDVIKDMLKLKAIKHLENYMYYFQLILSHLEKKSGKKGEEDDESSSMPNSGASSIVKKMKGNSGVSGEGEAGDGGDEPSDGEEGSKGTTPSKGDQPGEEYDGHPMGDVVTATNADEMKDHDWGLDDPDEAHEAAKGLVNAAVETMDDTTRGMMPARFTSAVTKINAKPVITWEKIFKKYVGTIPAGKRKTRLRLNRRQPNRFDLSGDMADKTLKIAVCIDTSGSVTDRMISKIINEVFAIVAKRKHEITVIECDCEVNRVYRVTKPSEVQLKVAGRGGTAFTPAIEYVNNDRYFRDAFLIYFTDGFGENSIPKPRTYRNLWVVFGKVENLSLKEPFGEVLPFKPQGDK